MTKQGINNFRSTTKTLEHFLTKEIEDDRDKAGVIHAFKLAFEQCWKALKQEAEIQGLSINSPKSAFTFAIQSKFISPDKEKLWLEMLLDRNLTSHTYKKELADQVVKRIQDFYLEAFQELEKHL